MNNYFLRLFFVSCLFVLTIAAAAQSPRWSEEKATNWYKQFPWLCGINYIPSDAVNYTAMWDKSSFNPQLIEKEMALAQSIGLNCARVVMQYAVYADDPAHFLNALDQFLAICSQHGVYVMPCFFDDCAFGTNTDPAAGKQPEPLAGWYAWAWSPSPGYTMVIDPREHSKLEKYVKDVMSRFKDDKRILAWDLYNEPTNTTMPERSLPLLEKVVAWAREINPVQPITIGVWNDNKAANEIMLANSDIITFHCYDNPEKTEARTKEFLQYNRPVICTEWMNRVIHSTVDGIMPFFKENNTGCMLWGLVNGKTQTHLCWGHRPEQLPYKGIWQHDLFRNDFTTYSTFEKEMIRRLNAGEPEQKKVPFGDPFIMLYKNTYYAYGTSSADGIAVYTSSDLVSWKAAGKLALKKEDTWTDKWFWAPEVYHVKGKFYMYFSANEHICAAVSDNPLGPFRQVEKKPMIEGEKCIDNSLFIDDDGTPYLIFDRFNDGLNIWVSKLEKDLIRIKPNTMYKCINVSQKWEEVWPRVNEGAFIIKHKGMYYMTYSANSYESPFYGIGFATATTINGPWTKYEKNPIYQNVGGLRGIGHSAMFTDKEGKLRIVFHAHNSWGKIHPRYMYISTVSFVEKDGQEIMEISPEYLTPVLED